MRTATWIPAGSLSVPAGSQTRSLGSYNSAVGTSDPPTTRTRPSASRVAVTLARATDMLPVAAQVPPVVPAGRVGVFWLAKAGAANRSTRQPAQTADLMRTRLGGKIERVDYKTLKLACLDIERAVGNLSI